MLHDQKQVESYDDRERCSLGNAANGQGRVEFNLGESQLLHLPTPQTEDQYSDGHCRLE
jgi:hypothetical protein